MSVHSQSAAQAASYAAATPEFPRHVVTAVIVSHDGARWLPDALTGLLGQERPVQNAIGADTGSADDSAQLLAEAIGDQRVLHLARRSGFGTAVDEAVRTAPVLTPDDLPYLRRPSGWDPVSRTWHDEAYEMPELPHGEPVQWLWLLHDDCAPEPDALAELLRVADASPSTVIVGPKLRSWYDRRQLLEAGVSIARSGRRWTGLDRREQDQGQHDQVRPVLSVSTAGMLIRRDVYEELGGFDRRLPLMRDDVDLCWRAQAAGHQVLVAPDAILRHAEAAARERRPIDCVGRSVANPHRVDKAGAVYTLLTNTRGRTLPYVLLRLLIGTFLRVIAYLVGKVPGQALDELAGLFGTLLRPGKILAARKRRGRPAVEASELRSLFPPPGATVRATVEQVAGNLAGRAAPDVASAGRHGAVESGPGGDDADFLEIEQFARLKRIARKPAPLLFLVLLLVSLVACRGLLGSGALTGGAMLPAPGSVSDLWSAYLDSWHAVGVGDSASAPPYLGVVALVSSIFFGSTGFAVTLLLVCSVPLAGLTAYFASRPLVASRLLRAWGSIAYAFLPAAAGALAGGRLGTAVLAILLPLMARAGVAASGLRLPRGTRPSWRATWAYALLITFTTAFTPVVWPIAVLLGAGLLVLRFLDGSRDQLLAYGLRFLAVLLAPMVVLAPWSLSLLTHPGRFFQEAGLGYGAGSASVLDLIGLSPGGPKAAGGVLLFGIVLAALAATLRDERQLAIRTAWAAALTGLLLAALGNGSGWTGPAMLVYGLALLCAAAVGAEGIRTRMANLGFGWKQPVAVLIALASLLAPLYAAVSWMITGAAGPLERRNPEQVPAFVAEESGTADRARTLVLDGTPGHVDYSLVRGSGARLGDADLAAEAGEDTRLGGIVAHLVAGSGADQTNQLGGYAVRYVLVRKGAPREMGRVLDATPGLTRLSQEDGSALWRVDRRVSRLSIVAGEAKDGTSAAESVAPIAVPAGPVDAHTKVPDGADGRVLRLADAADEGWQATLNGTPLKPMTVDGWAQGFALPAGGGTLDLTHENPLGHTLWLWAQGLLAVTLVVLALPGRRREIDDDLPEDAAAVQAAAASGDGRRARRLRAQAEAAGTPDAADAGAPAAPEGEQPLDPATDPAAGAVPVPDPAAGDPYGAVPQQPSYDQWPAAPQAAPDGQQPYAPADPYQAGQYGQQPYPPADPYQATDPYAADPYQTGVYDPYGYGQQQQQQQQQQYDGGPQHQQPYDDGAPYPGYPGSYTEQRRDGSDQQ
ncbi:GT2 family glycosyltransferase [Streptomyces sp. 2333.5]|uniref:glycosyltransferase family 2 protein n=1 Tax=unclassified Streptomyces TaxID=2593676 RepID=UPI000895FFEF|nr:MULTISPECIES: glycosyltransferase family 2 protein [unclassified Streptomyces]PJJ02336.1 GT2 family glycosyltransferase [Streptomyces sp. 2333.5]SED05460.1 Glycosyltransferase, GT2 family [Streptomyces sp. 2314.4]SED92196.1 Glycosyltransferase, GT2 family [Streptomyces sp. 2112.2]